MDSMITPDLQPGGVAVSKPASSHLSIPGRQGRRGWGLKRVVGGFCACLIAIGILFMVGCEDDDDEELVSISSARISDPNSVFGLFEQQGTQGFTFNGGLFGPQGTASTSPTTLSFSNVNVDGTASTADFRTVPQNTNEVSAEGSADGVDSCNYLYERTVQGTPLVGETRVPCRLCDFVITAASVPCGGTGPGQMVLQLAGVDTPQTRQTPPFPSNPIPVTLELDSDCNLIRVNDVEVVVEEQL